MNKLNINTWKGFIPIGEIEPIVELENKCWSPWLAASPNSLKSRSEVFPQGQLCIYAEEGLLATLSVNQILWDGKPENLPTWDGVAGDPTTYEQTFVPNGNTLCLMSMNVSPSGRGKQLPKLLIDTLLHYGHTVGAEHIIGSFRPSAYSQAVLESIDQGHEPPTFEVYCDAKNENGDPVDPWLRSLAKNGMKPIAIDHNAMVIPVTKTEFESYKQSSWQKLSIGGQSVWWCNETGFFYEQSDGSYIYKESNLWGSLYDKQ